MIHVTPIDEGSFEVVVEGDVETRHRVRLSEETCRQLAGPGVERERLIRESFRFLLEREPSSSILGEFELTVIGRYFPEYENEIRRRLGGG